MTAFDLLTAVLGVALIILGAMLAVDARGLRHRVAAINATRERGGRARTPAGVAFRGIVMVAIGLALLVHSVLR